MEKIASQKHRKLFLFFLFHGRPVNTVLRMAPFIDRHLEPPFGAICGVAFGGVEREERSLCSNPIMQMLGSEQNA